MTAIHITGITPKQGKKGEYYVIKAEDGKTYYCFDPAIKGAANRTIDANVEEQAGNQGTLYTIREFTIRPPELDARDKSIVAQVALKEAGATVRSMLEKDLLQADGIFTQTRTLFQFYVDLVKASLQETPPDEHTDLEPF